MQYKRFTNVQYKSVKKKNRHFDAIHKFRYGLKKLILIMIINLAIRCSQCESRLGNIGIIVLSQNT